MTSSTTSASRYGPLKILDFTEVDTDNSDGVDFEEFLEVSYKGTIGPIYT